MNHKESRNKFTRSNNEMERSDNRLRKIEKKLINLYGAKPVTHGIIPEPIIRCPKCGSKVIDIDPKWLAIADKAFASRGTNQWATIRSLALAQFREFGHLKGWMTQGECPEKECDGKWWDGEKLVVAVPHHVKEAAKS